MTTVILKRLIVWLNLCVAAVSILTEDMTALAQDNPYVTEPKKPQRRVRKKRTRPEAIDSTTPVDGSAVAAEGFEPNAKPRKAKKHYFGAMTLVGYQMTFKELTLGDGTKKSYTDAGLDISGLARYRLNLKSIAIPVDVGINYMTSGHTEDNGTTKAEVTGSYMFLSVGSGIELLFGKLAIPVMAYFDYKLSDSGKSVENGKTVSVSNALSSAYRFKMHTGALYSFGFFRAGAAVGFHMISLTPKQIANEKVESKTYNGLYFGLLAGAEF